LSGAAAWLPAADGWNFVAVGSSDDTANTGAIYIYSPQQPDQED